jgi:hypothetical protein
LPGSTARAPAGDGGRADRDGESRDGRLTAVREADAGRGGQTEDGTQGEAGEQSPARPAEPRSGRGADGGSGEQRGGDHARQGRGRGAERPGKVVPAAGDRGVGGVPGGAEPDQSEEQLCKGAFVGGVLGHASNR